VIQITKTAETRAQKVAKSRKNSSKNDHFVPFNPVRVVVVPANLRKTVLLV
jgi:hypothetical protein